MSAAERINRTLEGYMTSTAWRLKNGVSASQFRALCRGKLKGCILREGPYIFVKSSVSVKIFDNGYSNKSFTVIG